MFPRQSSISSRKGGAFNLKKLVAESSKCTGCGVCEIVCSCAWYKAKDKEKSAIRIRADDQDGYAIMVCDQCGACMNMCSIMALKRANNGVVRLDKKTCVGCFICVGECLRDFMRWRDDLPTPFKCIACGLCVRQCPSGALAIVEV